MYTKYPGTYAYISIYVYRDLPSSEAPRGRLGIAVWVYQDGALNWLPGGPGNNPFTTPPGGGFYWAAPVLFG